MGLPLRDVMGWHDSSVVGKVTDSTTRLERACVSALFHAGTPYHCAHPAFCSMNRSVGMRSAHDSAPCCDIRAFLSILADLLRRAQHLRLLGCVRADAAAQQRLFSRAHLITSISEGRCIQGCEASTTVEGRHIEVLRAAKG